MLPWLTTSHRHCDTASRLEPRLLPAKALSPGMAPRLLPAKALRRCTCNRLRPITWACRLPGDPGTAGCTSPCAAAQLADLLQPTVPRPHLPLSFSPLRPQISKSQAGTGSNHAVSSLKFRVLRHFLQLGYSVFLSDVDIVTLQNPFPFLMRDSDVEGMSDGFDNGTAYGACCSLPGCRTQGLESVA